MNWAQNISNIYIVEDELYKKDGFLILPETLFEEAEELSKRLLNDELLYHEVVRTLEDELLINELDNFTDEGASAETFVNFNTWYTNLGRDIIKQILDNTLLTDEYQFIRLLPPEVEVKSFNEYDQAFEFLATYQPITQNNKFKLWILDRELQGIDRNIDIINLLELISSKDKSAIGIVYTGKNSDLTTREQIYTFVQKMIEDNKPSVEAGELEAFLKGIEARTGKGLFLNNKKFQQEISESLNQLYSLKADINNLIWVLPKGGQVQDEDFNSAVNRAKYGFEIYRLINNHSNHRLRSMSFAMQETTKLELSDIEYLKTKSLIEGLNISDTLIRVHDSYASNEFSQSLLQEASYFDSIRNIESWDSSQPFVSSKKFERMLAFEKFDFNVNKYYRPIMTGDIFEIMHPTADGKTKMTYGMLLTQECDCVVREHNGKIRRKADYATMVSLMIKKNTQPITSNLQLLASKLEQELQKESIDKDCVNAVLEEMKQAALLQVAVARDEEGIDYKIPLYPFIYTNSDGVESEDLLKLQLYLRQTFHMPFSTLDLCSLSSHGVARFDKGDLSEVKEKIVSLYPSYYQNHLKGIIEKLEGITTTNSSFTKDTKIYERDLSMFQLTNTTHFNYRIRRIARLKMPHTNFVQAFFGLTQSNVGLPMDI